MMKYDEIGMYVVADGDDDRDDDFGVTSKHMQELQALVFAASQKRWFSECSKAMLFCAF